MPEATDLPSSSRALVPLIRQTQDQDAKPAGPARRIASFLTHLIATAERVPQARERNRAEPAEVIAAYQATIARIRRLDN